MKKLSLWVLCLISLTTASIAQNYRYVETLFSSSELTQNIIYGTAPFLNLTYENEASTTTSNLVMDIYEPADDPLSLRPAIIFAHGGGFATGSRTVDDMVAFCDSFARKGYVTVTIDYRQGVEVIDNGDLHYTRAAYRGVQDGRAAVRFLRANASTYRIDPNKIYWGGNSAGSFIGLNSIYFDSDEKPSYAGAVNYSIFFTQYSAPDLGNLDIGDNLDEKGTPDAVMACWGGVGDTSIIEPDNSTPVFLIHGTNDNIVDFTSGAPFNLNISDVYGSNSICTRLSNLGIPASGTYFVEGEGHEFYGVDNGNWENGTCGNNYWDTVVVKATHFYWQQHKPIAEFSSTINSLNVSFNNTSIDANSFLWNFGDGASSTEENPVHDYVSEGSYLVHLYIENEIASWDTISQIVEIGTVNSISDLSTSEISLYPNPSNGYTTVYLNNPMETVNLIVYDIKGKEVSNTHYKNKDSIELNIEGQKGIYFINVICNDESSILKYIKY